MSKSPHRWMMTAVNALMVVESMDRHRATAGPSAAEPVSAIDAVESSMAFVEKRPAQGEGF